MSRFALLLFCFLFSASVHASAYPNRDGAQDWLNRVNVLLNGNTSTVNIGPGSAGTPVPITSDTTPKAGGFGVRPAGSSGPFGGVLLDAKGNVTLGDTGKKAAVNVSAPVSRAAFLRGLGAVVSNPLVGIGFAVLAPEIGAWLASRGVRMNPDAADYPEKPFVMLKRRYDLLCQASIHYPPPVGLPALGSTSNSGCGDFPEGTVYLDAETAPDGTASNCSARNTCHASVIYKSWVVNGADSWGTMPASLDDIIPYMDAPDSPALTPSAVHEGVTKAGIDPFGGQYPKPAVTGPSTVPGQKIETSTQVRVHPGTTTEVAPGANTETQQATKTTTTTVTHNVTYNENKVTYNTTSITNTTITNNVTNQTSTTADTTKVEDDSKVEDKPEDPAVDTPLGDIPKLYERKYPDGLVGIWNDKKQSLKDSSVGTLVDQIVPNGMGDGGCPQWQIPLDIGIVNYGTHDLSIPCEYWAYLRIIMIVGSLFLARALIFGG